MPSRQPSPPKLPSLAPAAVLAVLALAAAAVAGGLSYHALAGSDSTSPTVSTGPNTHLAAPAHRNRRAELGPPPGSPPRNGPGRIDGADGLVAGDTTVFDTKAPAVAKLDRALLAALQQAATAARSDGLVFYVDSGWRSHAYQRHLFDDAVAKYGSSAEAARWVAPPGRSAHETGDAVDLGHADADAWLSSHGAAYGLCQVYANEAWHFELRPAAVTEGCPATYADASDDPRLQR